MSNLRIVEGVPGFGDGEKSNPLRLPTDRL